MSFWKGLGFQNLTGLTYSQLESLHDEAMVFLTMLTLVVMLISVAVYVSLKGTLVPDSEILEKTWTLIPIFILLLLATPSIRLLCLQDSLCQSPSSSMKLISNQWNWQSEWSEVYDHLLDVEELDNVGAYEVPVLMRTDQVTRMLIASTDVLHSIGLPSLGVKLDSVPGRLNSTSVEVNFPGLYVGSCYELCGSGHSVMPVNVLAL